YVCIDSYVVTDIPIPYVSYSHNSSNLILLFFFSTLSGYLRDLHSFPTRRSSDLKRIILLFMVYYCCRIVYSCCLLLFSSRSRSRSEEHTSELQSRENLVCRLLLVKKKISQQDPLTDK